ncbi:MAG: CotH kinase family protein [Myxococcota bacterium]
MTAALVAAACAPGRIGGGARPDGGGVAEGGGDDGGDEDGGGSAMPRGCGDIYAEDELPEFSLEMDPVEWGKILVEMATWRTVLASGMPIAPPHAATFRHGAQEPLTAVVRLLGDPARDWLGGKPPLRIAFDEVEVSARFHGLRAIELVAPPGDASLLRPRLALALFRDLGLPAPCAASARLVVNGAYAGVYTSVEPVDDVFLKRAFGNSRGALYRSGFEVVPTGSGVQPDAAPRDRFWATYDVEGLEAIVDLDEAVMEWAAEAMLPDGDGYWAGGKGYFLYDAPHSGLAFVPSGLDLAGTFDALPADADPLAWRAEGALAPPHFGAVLADARWSAAFVADLRWAQDAYGGGALVARLDAWSAEIAEAAALDASKPFSDAEHDGAVTALRAYLAARAEFIGTWLACRMGGDGGEDADGDGVSRCDDCDDADGAIAPGAVESCNGVDDDCDGAVDEDAGCPDCASAVMSGGEPLVGFPADRYFGICTLPRTWPDALAQCAALGGRLATPRNDAEEAFVADLALGRSAENWWLGINDIAQEGAWVESEGDPIAYFAWAPDRPNGTTDQNCVVLDAKLGGWNDKACGEAHPAVCRLPWFTQGP